MAIVIGKWNSVVVLVSGASLTITACAAAIVDVAVAQMASWNAAVVLLLLDPLFFAI